MLPLGLFPALFVGLALAGGDLVECAPLRFHSDVGVAGKHSARDVPGDAHDHFVAGARLSEFRYQGVAIIMPSAPHPSLLADFGPRRLERGDGARRVSGERRPEGEYEPLRPALPEPPGIPGGVRLQRGDARFVQRDHAPCAGFGFRLAHRERLLVDQVDLIPPDLAQFLVPETRVQIQREGCAQCATSAPPPASAPSRPCCRGDRVREVAPASAPCRGAGSRESERPARHRAAATTAPRR